MEKLYTAAEIVEMHLPGLPATKRAIQLRADKEHWHYETRVGLGGIRKVYEVPEAYLPNYVPLVDRPMPDNAKTSAERVAESAGKAGMKIDTERLAKALQVLDSYLDEKGIAITASRKSEIAVVLYNYLETHGTQEEVAQLLKLVA
ncbi:hypothetical protein ACO0LF_12265 [Undibacterium sp. Di27W]|uniref:hypothetical protein n=1 Tax=Undibacterium sp. Di27W TaxID=3413036 RepID=UPI003BF14434